MLLKIIWEQEVNNKKSEKQFNLTKAGLLSKCIPKCILDITCLFHKHIKIKGLGSDVLKVTQYIGKKYAYDMLALCVKINVTKNNFIKNDRGVIRTLSNIYDEVFYKYI